MLTARQAVLDRLRQIRPKILFTVDGYQYNGKWYDCLARATRVGQALSANDSTGRFDMVVIFNGPNREAQSVQRLSQGLFSSLPMWPVTV
jgi:acyl-coenzyme A synthetase/AMP-(fatty) acid ligase